jgi:hypothetical protein
MKLVGLVATGGAVLGRPSFGVVSLGAPGSWGLPLGRLECGSCGRREERCGGKCEAMVAVGGRLGLTTEPFHHQPGVEGDSARS